MHTHALTLYCWIDLVALNPRLVPWTLDLLLSLYRSYMGAETRDNDGQQRQRRPGPDRATLGHGRESVVQEVRGVRTRKSGTRRIG